MKPVLAVIVAAVVAFGQSPSAAAARPAEGAVTSISVAPAATRADVVIAVGGNVHVSEFALEGPNRVVVDIDGATLRVPPAGYDKAARGGITDVRYSQFRKNTVRVVIYLDAQHPYKVWRSVGQVHVQVTMPAGTSFAAWHVDDAPSTPIAPSQARVAEKAPASPTAATPSASTSASAKPVTPVPATPARASGAATQTTASAAAKTDKLETAAARPAPQQATRDQSAAQAQWNEPADRDRDEPARQSGRQLRPVVQQAQQRTPQPRITVTFQGSDIRDVLAAFAAFSGRTIIPSSAVPIVKVDAEIRDQPWDVALAAILSSQGLAATEDANGLIIVDTQERIATRAQTEPLVTRIVRLNYQRATAVSDQLRQRLQQCIPSERSSSAAAGQPPTSGAPPAQTSGAGTPGTASGTISTNCRGRGTVSADEVTNSISVTAPTSVIDDLVAFAETLDLRQPQVNIKAKIVLVNRTDLDALGIKYDLGSRNQFFSNIVPRDGSPNDPPTVLLGGNTVSAIANASGNVPGAALRLIYSTAIGRFDFSTFLDALQEVSLLDVQAEPSVTTLNNRTAELISGSQVPFVPLISSGGGGTSLTGPIAVERVQTGVTLRVTPSVTNNRQIMMRLEVTNSDVNFTNNGTLIDNNNTKNELLVADGQTVVIGGLTQTSVRVTKSGLPLLVDLPLIGRLFGYTTRQEQRRDLLILITPHIVDEGQQSPEARP
jgi:type IV pilus assembly protein PilQ